MLKIPLSGSSQYRQVKDLLRKIETVSSDVYLRKRASDLISNLDDVQKAVALALTLRSSPCKKDSKSAIEAELLEAWPHMKKVFHLGLPGHVMWEPFKAIYSAMKQKAHEMETLAQERHLEKDYMTALFVAYAEDLSLEKAWKNHERESYFFVPFDCLRHTYDFFTVVWPCDTGQSNNIAETYKTSLRALRAIGLFLHMDFFDDFCTYFQESVMDPLCNEWVSVPGQDKSIELSSRAEYKDMSVSYSAIDRLLKSATQGKLSMRKSGHAMRTTKIMFPQAVSALADVACLLGLSGRDVGLFQFDAICGLSVHPSTRLCHGRTPPLRWYGVSWAILRKLHEASELKTLFLPEIVPLDRLVWIDAKEDARHLWTDTEWARMAVAATEISVDHWAVREVEERAVLCEQNSVEIVEFLSGQAAESSIELQLVECEPESVKEDKVDFLLAHITVPHADSHLFSLVKTLGCQYLAQHSGAVTRERLKGPLACLFQPTYPPDEFWSGLKEVLQYVTRLSDLDIRHVGSDPERLLYDIYKEYHEMRKEPLFLHAIRASAFYYMEDHQYIATTKLRDAHLEDDFTVTSLTKCVSAQAQDYATQLDAPVGILQKVLATYNAKLKVSSGSSKLTLLAKIHRLSDIVIPRAYKYANLSLLDVCLPVIEMRNM